MLFTQCRGCGEVFIIDAEHLTLAHGQVRCHVCGTVFNSLETLTAEPPLDGEDLLLHDQGHAPPLLTRSVQTEEDESTLETDHDSELNDDLLLSTDDVDDFSSNDEDDLEGEAFSFLDKDDKKLKADLPYSDESTAQNTGGKWWGLMSLALLMLFAWQGQQALADGRLRLPDSNWARAICDKLSCAEHNRALDLSNISLVSRNIRSHPGRDNALIISASMIKTQSDDQRFPALSISLSDLDGQVIAMRRFQAEEYLTRDILQAGFVNNTLVPITLEIQNPGELAVAFEIGFSQP